MLKDDKIDFSKLFGFDAVRDQLAKGIDFQDETLSAKLGDAVRQMATRTIPCLLL